MGVPSSETAYQCSSNASSIARLMPISIACHPPKCSNRLLYLAILQKAQVSVPVEYRYIRRTDVRIHTDVEYSVLCTVLIELNTPYLRTGTAYRKYYSIPYKFERKIDSKIVAYCTQSVILYYYPTPPVFPYSVLSH